MLAFQDRIAMRSGVDTRPDAESDPDAREARVTQGVRCYRPGTLSAGPAAGRVVGLIALVLSCLWVHSCSPTGTSPACPRTVFVPPITAPAWHPSGGLITFNLVPLIGIEFPGGPECGGQSILDRARMGVYSLSLDSLARRRLSAFTVSSPSWSPAGDRMAFEKGGNIYTIGFDGSDFDTLGPVPLTSDGISFGPAWSPDGAMIAYERVDCPGSLTTCGIFAMSPTGEGKRRLAGGIYPAWFPDSRRIVYVGLWNELYVFDLLDSTVVQLTHMTGGKPTDLDIRFPKVAPDGSAIALLAQPAGKPREVWIMGTDGRRLSRLVSGVAGLCWSPDSREIGYVSYRATDYSETNGSLWVVEVNTGVKRLLATGRLNE